MVSQVFVVYSQMLVVYSPGRMKCGRSSV